MKLEDKQIGALIAFVLAVVMLFLPGPDRGRYSFNPTKLSDAILESEDQLSPVELSSWIIEGKNDYQLIDIRTPDEYKKGSIKNAVNIPLKKLLKKETIENSLSDKMAVIFSNGNSHAHQAWLILKSAGIETLVLEGGYNHWGKTVLNPKMPVIISDDEILRYRKRVAVAGFLGGVSEQGSDVGESTSTTDSQKKKAPGKKKKKKLGGC